MILLHVHSDWHGSPALPSPLSFLARTVLGATMLWEAPARSALSMPPPAFRHTNALVAIVANAEAGPVVAGPVDAQTTV